jgi:hypothetical protein
MSRARYAELFQMLVSKPNETFVHSGTERVAPITMAPVSHYGVRYDLENNTLGIN